MRVVTKIVDGLIAIVEAILGIRLVLKLFAANPSTPFVKWIYKVSDVLLSPFYDIFPAKIVNNINVIEFTTLFAMIVFLIVGSTIIGFARFLTQKNERQPPISISR